MENVIKTKEAVIGYINNKLQGYEGYVQFSHRPIDKDKDIFLEGDVKVENEEGFVYEAHFANDSESIAIRQINDAWLVSKVDISNVSDSDKTACISGIEGMPHEVVMAQIWQSEFDPLCEGMKVMKLKKVVFAGFE